MTLTVTAVIVVLVTLETTVKPISMTVAMSCVRMEEHVW